METKSDVRQVRWNDLLGGVCWKETTHCDGEDTLYTAYIEDGSRITVLDRMTGYGYGIRDIESGYKDKDGLFWLASGHCDVRRYCGELTVAQAVEWIKAHANNCIGA